MNKTKSCIPILLAALSLSPVMHASVQEPTGITHPFYVHSYADFLAHTNQHIQNVQKLGRFIYFSWAKDFSAVSPDLVAAYLQLHDLAKIADLATLQEFGYQGTETLGSQLYQFYGKDYNTLPELEKNKMRNIIDQVNFIDQKIRNNFFKTQSLLGNRAFQSESVQALLKIEAIADLVDRNENPISAEEFNKEMKSASDFLPENSDKNKAQKLELFYHRIIHNDFVGNRVRCKNLHE